jgi:hypothetical protein
VIEDSLDWRRFARHFSWSAATERLVNTMFVVIISEILQLSPQVDSIPNYHLVKKLPSYRPDQPFDEWM